MTLHSWLCRVALPADARRVVVRRDRGLRLFLGRDTRGSGLELERALARGIASAGGSAVVAGVLPTPAVALLTLDLGCVITASHNPPEYNGVKFFDHEGFKLSDDAESEIEGFVYEPVPTGARPAASGSARSWPTTSARTRTSAPRTRSAR